jgi:hypothetical protein
MVKKLKGQILLASISLMQLKRIFMDGFGNVLMEGKNAFILMLFLLDMS